MLVPQDSRRIARESDESDTAVSNGSNDDSPASLILLDAEGVRSKEKDFQLHKNDNGLILGFSLLSLNF